MLFFQKTNLMFFQIDHNEFKKKERSIKSNAKRKEKLKEVILN